MSNRYVIMSLTLTVSNNSSVLEANFFPPLVLDGSYDIGLVSFLSFNTIPNVDYSNCRFHYTDSKFIDIPIGSYEIVDIAKVINEQINKKYTKDDAILTIDINENTMNCVLTCTKRINFKKHRSIGSLLGFINCFVEANVSTESNSPVNISKINAIRVECNITSSSYLNGAREHVIHEFFPNVKPGYKIVEIPKNIIYLPVAVQTIDHLSLQIVDENKKLVNFQGETITIRVHLKKNVNI